jgi:hypothetical protein
MPAEMSRIRRMQIHFEPFEGGGREVDAAPANILIKIIL